MNIHKSICIFAAGDLFNIGGLQRSYSILTDHLIKSGHKVMLIAWEKSGKERKDISYAINEQVEIIFVPQNRTSKNFNHIQAILKQHPIDVILIVNSGFQALFLSMISLSLGIPYVVSLRGGIDYCLEYLWPSRFAMELLFKSADAAHVLMPSYKEFFESEVKSKISVIPSQIEPAKSFAKPAESDRDGKFYLLYSGRFSFEKRIEILINAFNHISKDFPDWILWVVGNGPLKDELIGLVSNLGMDTKIIFSEAKNTDEMYSIYPRAHIKILPSENEGCPMALREAMAHGLPVIAFDECSGANEIIQNNVDGLLIPSGSDRVESMSIALRSLMKSPELRTSLGNRAIETAARYTPGPINKSWEDLLVSTANRGSLPLSREDALLDSKLEARNLLFKLISKNRFTPPYHFLTDQKILSEYSFNYAINYGVSLFDVKYYLDTYYEVKKSGMDPLLHYLSTGHKDNYNPSSKFDTKKYRDSYMENCFNLDPLTHFMTVGRFEGAVPDSVDPGDRSDDVIAANELNSSLLKRDIQLFSI